MSMIGNFRRVSTRVIEDLRAHPDRIKKVLYPDSTETVIDEDVRIDIDKAWQGIHYLLTGDASGGQPPLNFILAGTPIGDVDVGYGPARGFTSAQVRSIAAALALINRDQLRARYDAKRMAALDLYPGGWDQPDSADYLLRHFDELKDFVTVTADAEAGMIVYLN